MSVVFTNIKGGVGKFFKCPARGEGEQTKKKEIEIFVGDR